MTGPIGRLADNGSAHSPESLRAGIDLRARDSEGQLQRQSPFGVACDKQNLAR